MSRDLEGQRILLGVSGGIAAYKTAYLARELLRLGASVRVVMTKSSTQFITPMTFQALTGEAPRLDLFDEVAERAMSHIELARWAHALIIAPATAHCMAKLAHGMADDLLSTLALVIEAPIFICPGMNRSMWSNPATVHNANILTARGIRILGPAEGEQACGEYGLGRLLDVEHIITALRLKGVSPCLLGKHVLITAGPTREWIDPVRYIGNRSSGKMGYALAAAAVAAGARVTLVSGPTALSAPIGVTVVDVDTAEAMHQAVMCALEPGSIFIGAAAVSDFGVSVPHEEKIKKHQQQHMLLTLEPQIDILATVAASKRAAYVVGFAAETSHVLAYAREKRQKKNVDMMIANQVGYTSGFDVDEHEVTVLTVEMEKALPKQHKMSLAGELIAMIAMQLSEEKSV